MRFDASFPLFSHIVRKSFIIFIFSLIAVSAHAQSWPNVFWLNEGSQQMNALFPDSTLREWNGEFWEIRDSIALGKLGHNDFQGVDVLNPILNSTPLHFVAPGTQQVYILDEERGIFQRDDSTYHRGYNYSSIKWWRNDTLFTLGGYGFWHTHAILSYYHPESKEWHVLPTSKGPMNITSDFYHWSADGKHLYVAYSKIIHGSEVERSSSVWRLNVSSRTWEEIGQLNAETVNLLKSSTRKLILPIGVLVSDDQHHLINFEENRIDLIETSVIDLRYREEGFRNGRGSIPMSTYYMDFVVPSTSNVGRTISFRYGYDDILRARRNPEKVYYSGWPTWVWVTIVLAVGVVVWLIVLFIKRLRKPFLKGSTVQAEEKFFHTLEPQEVKLLKALLRSEMRGEGLKSAPITEIMGWQDKSWDNQRKWRNNLIKELNRRAEENLNIEELIYREKDPYDKRERVYHLNGDGFRLLRDSIHFN